MLSTLYWLTNDLRIEDNPALLKAANSDVLVITFCEPLNNKARESCYHVQKSPARQAFMQQSLTSLNQALTNYGQGIIVSDDDATSHLSQLIMQYDIGKLVCSRQFGVDEQRVLKILANRFTDLSIEQVDTSTLFNATQDAVALPTLPSTFSKFRKLAEQTDIPDCVNAPEKLPPPPAKHSAFVDDKAMHVQGPFQGGIQTAQQHLTTYFNSDAPSRYKEVRNELDGFDNSSKMSPWLNLGSLSARQIYHRIKAYEQDVVANDSTYWLYFELLWREYFQWNALKIGKHLYTYSGLSSQRSRCCFYPERFKKWCHGNTPYPLVNALMKELKATGYMSNRGRQIAASCLIYDLGVDWRFGAAWFEKYLLDYNPASNWGNWQYIAGVGADLRGGRHFNIDKQIQQYDPNGVFIAKWSPEPYSTVLDTVDMVDWPIEA